ncbi:MAG: ZIP family metal transporter [Bacteroidota bacterium]
MQLVYTLLLFVITFAGGSIPLWVKGLDDKRMNYLLAFSGSFLLGITFLHLLPEAFSNIGARAGFYLLIGFFIQLLIQRITHGIEHGHAHIHPHEHHIPLLSILLGISIHAFMEGLPLGFNYSMKATQPSLYLAVAAHKLPEAMLVTSLVISTKGKQSAIWILLLFSCITPVAGILANTLGNSYPGMASASAILVPIVAGAFIHIATTIFYESGTKQHTLSTQKILAILIGVSLAFITLIFE